MNIDDVLKSHGFGGGEKNIKSIQRGLTKLVDGTTTTDIPINTVNTTNSLINISDITYQNAGSSMSYANAQGSFLDENTLRLTRYGTSFGTNKKWEVIEFDDVKSVQSGTLSLSTATTISTPINSIDISKSLLSISYKTNSGTSLALNTILRYRITSPTTFEIVSYYVAPHEIVWKIIELR